MAYIETWVNQEMTKPVKVNYLGGTLFSQDVQGNLIGVRLTKNGEDYADGGTVSGNVIRADGGTVAITGSISGNKAQIILPAAVYAVVGAVTIIIKLTQNGQTATIGAFGGMVYASSTDTVVDPGTIIPSIADLIAQIQAAVGSIPADYSALTNQVSDLKSAIEGFSKKLDIVFNDGYYISQSGDRVTSANWTATSYLDISGEALMLTMPLASGATALANVACAAFYSKNATAGFISSVPIGSGTNYTMKWAVIPIPEGTTVARFSMWHSLMNNLEIYQIDNLAEFMETMENTINQLIDNDDVKVFTRLNVSNETYGFGADSMLIRLKKSAFRLAVNQNHQAYDDAWEATWNAYYWLRNRTGNILFATNCNFSGGTTKDEVENHHYPMRYDGVNYDEGAEGAPMKRPFFCFDDSNEEVAYYPRQSDETMYQTLQSIPSRFRYAFACGNMIIQNGVATGETPIDFTTRGPRNVFGWDDDYYYIWFCEGRNDKNGGYKFPEMVSRLLDYGVQNAINLDGGGSVCVSAKLADDAVKVNEYVDSIHIRPTSLNLNYTYIGNNKNPISEKARSMILAYMANVFHPVRADLMRVLGTIYGNGKVKYNYHEERGGYYKLEVIQTAPQLLYITFDSLPNLTYNVGDTLDLTGMVIAAAYSDDTVENVTEDCVCTPADGAVLTAADQALTVTFTDGNVTKTITTPLIVS